MRQRVVGSLLAIVGLVSLGVAPLKAQAVSDSVEFVRWRKAHQDDIDGLRQKFMALARAIPADKLSWKPMDGTRSFHDVFAHIAAEGFIEGVSFGRPLPAGSQAQFDPEEARLRGMTDEQVIAAMDRAMENLSAGFAGLSKARMNTPVAYFGQQTLPREIAMYTLIDLHEHLGQLVSYARMNQIVPPWTRH